MSEIELISRRALLVASTSALLLGCTGARAADDASVTKRLAAIQAETGGRIGVYALDTQSGRHVGFDQDSRYAMASTFKLLLAACILSRVDRGELSLARSLSFSEKDGLPPGPVTSKALSKGSMTVEELCAAMVEVSDNGAANLLLPLVGGPAGFTAFARTLGDSQTRLDRFEVELNSNLPGDPRDSTTPRAMVGSMKRVLVDDVLSKASRERLIDWLVQAKTGLQRLRGGLPASWRAGDKTGTGMNGAANDVAIAWPPGRGPILMAVYLSESNEPLDKLNAGHSRIARLIAEALTA